MSLPHPLLLTAMWMIVFVSSVRLWMAGCAGGGAPGRASCRPALGTYLPRVDRTHLHQTRESRHWEHWRGDTPERIKDLKGESSRWETDRRQMTGCFLFFSSFLIFVLYIAISPYTFILIPIGNQLYLGLIWSGISWFESPRLYQDVGPGILFHTGYI